MNESPRRNRWVRWAVGLFWALGAGMVVWLAWRYRLELIPYLTNISPVGLLRAFGWYLVSLAAIVAGWTLLMRHFAPGTHWWTHVWIYCLTLAARRLPGTVWYVGGRLVLYRREGISRTLVSIASSVEYAVILVSGALVGLALLPAAVDIPGAGVGALALAAALAALSPRLVAWLAVRLGRPLPAALRIPDMLAWLAAMALMWLAGGLMVVEIVRAFGLLPPAQTGFILGAWALAGTLGALTYFLPSSFGVSEISLAFFLGQIIPLPAAGAVAILTRLLTIAFELVLAAAFLPWARKNTAA